MHVFSVQIVKRNSADQLVRENSNLQQQQKN